MSSQVRAQKRPPPSLITSLPQDVIIHIIARVPRCYYPTISLVSKHFQSLVLSPDLYERRSLLSCTEACIYLVLFNNETNEYRLYFLTRKDNISSLVLITQLRPLPINARFVAVGSKIYVFGGIYGKDMTSNVLSIDCRYHTVQLISNIPGPMGNNVAIANIIKEKIYILGKCKSEMKHSWKVMAFNTKSETWEPEMAKVDFQIGPLWDNCVVMDDKMYMRDSRNTFVYGPKERKWEMDKILNAKKWLSADVLDDVLYYYDCYENKLKAYDPMHKLWEVVEGVESVLPGKASIQLSRTVSYGGKLAIFFSKERGLKIKKIWCAEIAVERCQAGEIRGKVKWCNVVLYGRFQIMKSLVVMV